MNKFLKRIVVFLLLFTMVAPATGCQLISLIFPTDNPAPVEPGNPDDKPDEPVLTGVDKVIYDARKETDERIEEIRNTPNMEIPEDATVYYVSEYGDDKNDGLTEDTAWLTLDKVNSANIPEGAYVCFQRGGVWRGQLVAKEGVTYTAYDVGDKPVLMASPENGADPSKWEETEYENVWRYTTKFDLDVGLIVVNDGEQWGDKMVVWGTAGTDPWTYPALPEELMNEEYYNGSTLTKWEGLSSLNQDLQFYHNVHNKLFDGDINDKFVYVYSEGNPGERFDSIEFNIQQHIVSVTDVNDVTINNLCLKYTGAHGVSAMNVENFTCSELEVGWIGGSLFDAYTLNQRAVRYGNGIQLWAYCDGWYVEDCYVYQCYDAGITPQTNVGTEDFPYDERNIYIENNVIENCWYAVEYFNSFTNSVKQVYENFYIENNYMWYAGQGICNSRRDKEISAFIKGTGNATYGRNNAENFVIKNNVMIDATDYVMETRWCGSMSEEEISNSAPVIEDNIFVSESTTYFGIGYYVWVAGVPYVKYDFTEDYSEVLNENYGSGNECWVMK